MVYPTAVRLSLMALACALTVGCFGGSGIKETVVSCRGKVTNGGQPLAIAKPMVGWVELTFTEHVEGAKPAKPPNAFSAKPEKDGSFTVAGRVGNGIPAGKYRIAVRQWDPYPQVDKLNGKFDEANTKIIREVTGKGDLVIDVSKPEG